MILGTAYQFKTNMPGQEINLPVQAFSGEHSLPAQRAYSVLCIAYGADKKLFADIVQKELLPRSRADVCEAEYDDLTFAVTKLISPHIHKRLAKKFNEVWTRSVSARRARLAPQ